jgi:hypothetical protein
MIKLLIKLPHERTSKSSKMLCSLFYACSFSAIHPGFYPFKDYGMENDFAFLAS